MTFGRQQHVDEASCDMRTDRLALEGGGEAPHKGPEARNGEVVAPEMGEALQQRRVGFGRGADARLDLGEVNRLDLLIHLFLVALVLVAALLEHLGHHAR